MRSPPEPFRLAPEAAELLSWATQALAGVVDVPLDPVKTRELVKGALQGRTTFVVDELDAALRKVLEGSRLTPAQADDFSGRCDTVELPVVTLSGGGLALLSRKGGRIAALRPGQAEPQALTVAEAQAAVAALPGPWLTAAPAAPLQALAAHPPDEHRTPTQRLAVLLHLERDDLWIVVIYAVAVGLLTLAVPVAVQSLVSTVAFGTLLQPLLVLSLLLLLALGFQAALRALQTRVVEALEQRFFARTTLDLAWRLPRVKPEAVPEGFGPELVNRFFDVLTVQKAANVLLTDGLAVVLQIGIGLLVLAFYHPALLAFDLVLVAGIVALISLPARRGLDTALTESKKKYAVAAWLEELARPGAAFRGQSGAELAASHADALTRAWLDARRAHFSVVFSQTVGALALQVLASAALLGLGGWLVIERELTLGQLVAAELIVAAVTTSVAKFGKLLDKGYDLLVALDKLGHLLDLPVEDPDHGERVPGQGPIRIEVKGATDGVEAPVSFDVPAGARLAIVGARGHPVARWLAALGLPQRGVVAFNSVELSRGRCPALREDLALVERGDLFDGSVLDNITLGRPFVSAGDARAALERVGLLDEVRALPVGLDTRLTRQGSPLTPSQQTRLLVARAIAGAPRLIVVDESLEGLDPLSRSRCVSALTRPGAPWTLIALVTDPAGALPRACGRIVPLEQAAQPPPDSAEPQVTAT